jgi:serine/threonine protein kinase
VHANLRPENILVGPEDQISLVDRHFSDTRRLVLVAGDQDGHSDATDAAAYLSPEQALRKTPDSRSDLYALGVILNEMLTGTVLRREQGFGPRMATRLSGELLTSRTRNSISRPLQAIVRRAIEPDPDRRYANVAEFAWDLTHPEHVKPFDPPASRNRPNRRTPSRRSLVDVTLALAPVAAIGVVLYYLLHNR